jgi:hypothetical protein
LIKARSGGVASGSVALQRPVPLNSVNKSLGNCRGIQAEKRGEFTHVLAAADFNDD